MENKIEKELPETGKILKIMCNKVGADYGKIDFKKVDWFYEYSWTEKEQYNFKKWLINYWKNNSKARLEMLSLPSLTDKEILEKAASWFILDFGWKINLKRTK